MQEILDAFEHDLGVIIAHSCTHSLQFMTIVLNTENGFT